jgi:hypothetical protein
MLTMSKVCTYKPTRVTGVQVILLMLVSHVLKLASGDINNQEEGKKALRIILVREKRHA